MSPSPKIKLRIFDTTVSVPLRFPKRLDNSPEVDASLTVLKSSDFELLFAKPPITAGNNAEIAFEIPDSLSPS
ncbi:hypothetical protein D3C86_1336620 [compost metagenome]